MLTVRIQLNSEVNLCYCYDKQKLHMFHQKGKHFEINMFGLVSTNSCPELWKKINGKSKVDFY